MAFNHEKIESKWQKRWEESSCFQASNEVDSSSRPKFYALDMFPYPSGKGLHVGHLASYTPTDIVARFKRAQGFNVLHPMGYDAFGLPAEQYAIQTGVHPAVTTGDAIVSFRNTLKTYGYSFDWSREVSTCSPDFYKWTQFIFLKLFEKGLAYQKEVPVNWCPALRTVLANEEVVDGKSERGGHPVIRLPMKQWMLKITEYAERLLQDLDKLDWPEKTKEGQRHWIGKSEGARVYFEVSTNNIAKVTSGVATTANMETSPVATSENMAPSMVATSEKVKLEVFTTRPDTLFGVTFMVLAPEHPLVSQITTPEQKVDVEFYREQTARKSELDRKTNLEKTGAFTGAYATHPLTQKKIPIWISDYVLMDYGTGAIMAVPGHDERDFDFASQFNIPIVRVLESEEDLPFIGSGLLCHSEFLNGLSKEEAISQMVAHLEKHNLGERQINYKLRDWLFSRQRYWGEPFPIYTNANGELKAVSYEELPVSLPEVADYEPSEKGEPPLARVEEWVQYTNPETKEKGLRNTDTMPGSAGSSWYFLRYCDPHNKEEPFSFEAQKYWMPVDLYVGGAEHTVGHLLYSRFWQKVLFDCGLVSCDEPFQKLAHQGTILGPDGQKMSKSRGNVINPDVVREEYGSDAVRLYVSFMGPFDKDKPWDTHGIEGVRRFLERIWRLVFDETGQLLKKADGAPIFEAGSGSAATSKSVSVSESLKRTLHKTIKKVTQDIESMSFNTAVSAMMILVNELYKENCHSAEILKPLAQLLMPFAPHFSEELWEVLGGEGLASLAPWPPFDESLTEDKVRNIGVQLTIKNYLTIRFNIFPGTYITFTKVFPERAFCTEVKL